MFSFDIARLHTVLVCVLVLSISSAFLWILSNIRDGEIPSMFSRGANDYLFLTSMIDTPSVLKKVDI
jgi:hypothetical protein